MQIKDLPENETLISPQACNLLDEIAYLVKEHLLEQAIIRTPNILKGRKYVDEDVIKQVLDKEPYYLFSCLKHSLKKGNAKRENSIK